MRNVDSIRENEKPQKLIWGVRQVLWPPLCTVLTALMPRSQPAVRATALACLVLRQSYVSNSASPAADWGLKVILQPPYRQRTSLVAALPPDAPNRTQKIPQRRHVQRTGAVPSRYLQRVFAVPRATCPYGGVRICISVARRRCVEGTTHMRRTHGHTLPAQSIYSEIITGIPEQSSTLVNTVKTHQLTWHGTPGLSTSKRPRLYHWSLSMDK